MVHLRAKDSKARKLGDFSKKRRKVGKVVQRSNVTNIKVKSKKIHIPLQNEVTSKNKLNDKENLDRILRNIHHYSSGVKISALEELKQFLSASSFVESFIALIVPSLMELLYDENMDTRKSLKFAILLILKSTQSTSLASIASVAITYICSGLTSLHKGVRKDSLIVLNMFCEYHSSILVKYIDKLMHHVIAILADICHGTSQAAHMSSMTTTKEVATSNASTGGGGGTQPQTQSNNASKTNLLTILLQVISGLLSRTLHGQSGQLSQQDSKPWRSSYLSNSNKSNNNPNSLHVVRFDCSSPYNAAIILNTKSHVNKYYETKSKNFSSSKFDTEDTASITGEQEIGKSIISFEILKKICPLIEKLWKSLTFEKILISNDVLPPLKDLANIVFKLGQILKISLLEFKFQAFPAYDTLINTMISCFPHISTELEIAVAGSFQAVEGLKSVNYLNISLCDLVLMYGTFGVKKVNASDDTVDEVAAQFLIDKLEFVISLVETDFCEKQNVDNLSVAEGTNDVVEMEENSDSEEDDDASSDEGEESKIPTFKSKKSPARSIENDDEEMATKLFRAITLMTLSLFQNQFQSVSSNSTEKFQVDSSRVKSSRDKSSSKVVAPVQHELFDFHGRISHLFTSIKRLITVLSSPNNIQRDFNLMQRYGLKQLINCVCLIFQDDSFWLIIDCRLYILASEVISAIPNMLRGYANVPESLYLSTMQVVLFLLQRSSEDEIAQSNDYKVAIQHLSDSILLWFNGKTTKSQSTSLYHLHTPALRFLLLDIYSYGYYENFKVVSKAILKSVAASDEVDEISYFLQLFYDRRQLMNVPDFISLLFYGIETGVHWKSSQIQPYISSCIRKNSQQSQPAPSYSEDDEFKNFVTSFGQRRNISDEVANILGYCSNSENPSKIIQFLLPYLEPLKSSVLSAASSPSEGSSKAIMISQYTKLLLSIFLCKIVDRLLVPFSAASHDSDEEEPCEPMVDTVVATNSAIEILSKLRLVFSSTFVWICAHVEEMNLLKLFGETETASLCNHILNPFISVLATAECSSYEAKNNRLRVSGAEFATFNIFLDEFEIYWLKNASRDDIKCCMIQTLRWILDGSVLVHAITRCRERLQSMMIKILPELENTPRTSEIRDTKANTNDFIHETGMSILKDVISM